MALSKYGNDAFCTRWSVTDDAPALSPMMVIASGAPPKEAMFSRTQINAARWSCIP